MRQFYFVLYYPQYVIRKEGIFMKIFIKTVSLIMLTSVAAFTLSSCSCSCTPRGCNTSKKIKTTEATVTETESIENFSVPEESEETTGKVTEKAVKGNEVEKSYGSYIISDKWEYAENHSNRNQDFYCPKGEKDSVKPNNIFVRYDTCRYSKDQAQLFGRAILEQIGLEKHKPDNVTSSGSSTVNGYPLLTFNMTYPEGTITHYYIVGDNEFVLISEAVYDEEGKSEADEVAKSIIDSFEFN